MGLRTEARNPAGDPSLPGGLLRLDGVSLRRRPSCRGWLNVSRSYKVDKQDV